MNKTEALALMSSAEIEAVGGGLYYLVGWCGNEPRPLPSFEPPIPDPQPWFQSKLDLVGLNPQPLPPREIFFF